MSPGGRHDDGTAPVRAGEIFHTAQVRRSLADAGGSRSSLPGGNYALDSVDGDVLLELGLSDETYQTIDKAADYYSYVIVLAVGTRRRIRCLIALLFIYRTIGQALFFLIRNEIAFLYFPNFLEPLVLIYTVLLARRNGQEPRAYASYQRYRGPIWFIIGYKLWNESYWHLANIDLSEQIFGFTGGSRERSQIDLISHSDLGR